MTKREPVTLAELDAFDGDELTAGYRDGRSGEPEPGDNRTRAYWHGWRNGANDRANTSEQFQRDIARALRESEGEKP